MHLGVGLGWGVGTSFLLFLRLFFAGVLCTCVSMCMHLCIRVVIFVQEGISELRVKLSSLEQSVSSPPITCTCHKEPTQTATSTAPPSKPHTL